MLLQTNSDITLVLFHYTHCFLHLANRRYNYSWLNIKSGNTTKNLLVVINNQNQGWISMKDETIDFEDEEWDIEEWGDEWDDIDDDDW